MSRQSDASVKTKGRVYPYADDVIIHYRTRAEAEELLAATKND